MKTATTRDLHLRTRAILEEVAGCQIFVIERRGTPVAELRPFQIIPPTRRLPNREKLLTKLPRVRTDSGRVLEDLKRTQLSEMKQGLGGNTADVQTNFRTEPPKSNA